MGRTEDQIRFVISFVSPRETTLLSKPAAVTTGCTVDGIPRQRTLSNLTGSISAMRVSV